MNAEKQLIFTVIQKNYIYHNLLFVCIFFYQTSDVFVFNLDNVVTTFFYATGFLPEQNHNIFIGNSNYLDNLLNWNQNIYINYKHFLIVIITFYFIEKATTGSDCAPSKRTGQKLNSLKASLKYHYNFKDTIQYLINVRGN